LKVKIEISESCNLCGLCEQLCPTGVFRVAVSRLEVAESKCIYCKGCEIACPKKAINLRALEENLVIMRWKTLMVSGS